MMHCGRAIVDHDKSLHKSQIIFQFTEFAHPERWTRKSQTCNLGEMQLTHTQRCRHGIKNGGGINIRRKVPKIFFSGAPPFRAVPLLVSGQVPYFVQISHWINVNGCRRYVLQRGENTSFLARLTMLYTSYCVSNTIWYDHPIIAIELVEFKKEDNAPYSFATVPSKEDWKDYPIDLFVSLSCSCSSPKNRISNLTKLNVTHSHSTWVEWVRSFFGRPCALEISKIVWTSFHRGYELRATSLRSS